MSDNGRNDDLIKYSEDNYSAKKSKYEMWTSMATLLSVILGFIITQAQLLGTSKGLARIEQNVEKRPLEGIWEYETRFTKYWGDRDNENDPKRHAEGRAAFFWYGDKSNGQYHVLMGGGVYERGKLAPFATHVIDAPLMADESGNPIDNAIMKGHYLSRTSSIQTFSVLGHQTIEFRDMQTKRGANTINEMTFTIQFSDNGLETKGTVRFTRPASVW